MYFEIANKSTNLLAFHNLHYSLEQWHNVGRGKERGILSLGGPKETEFSPLSRPLAYSHTSKNWTKFKNNCCKDGKVSRIEC